MLTESGLVFPRRPETLRRVLMDVLEDASNELSGLGSTHFLTRRLENVSTEMSLHVLAYDVKRVIAIRGLPKDYRCDEDGGRLRPVHELIAPLEVPLARLNANLSRTRL